MRKPSPSNSRATPRSSVSSPPRNSLAISPARRIAPQSGIRSPRSGRVTAPRKPTSATPRALQRRQQLADLAEPHPEMRKALDLAPGRAGEADQEHARGRPARASRAASSGRLPPPQTMASGRGCSRRLVPRRRAASAPRGRRPRAGRRRSPASPRCRDSPRATCSMRSLQRAVAGEQLLVGAPHGMDVLVRKAAPLHADDIDAGRARRDCRWRRRTGSGPR